MMNACKKLYLLIVMIFLIPMLTVSAEDLLSSSNMVNPTGQDILIESRAINENNVVSIPLEFQELIDTYANAKYENYVNDKVSHDLESFYYIDALSSRNLYYQKNKWELIEKIRAQFDFTIIWYDINNKITSINELSDNLVIVTVKELYSYLTDIEGTTDKSMAKYVIDYTLIKKNGSWYIYNISSCDEFDTMYFNMELDVEALLKKLDNEIDLTPRPSGKSDLEYIREQNELNAPSVKGSWYTTSFTRSYASSYASNYWEEDSYNDNFYNYSADCQNFASQCIWYAFGGINTAASIESRVVPMMYNTTDSRDWYQCDGYGECDATYRWVNCDNFAEYIDTSFYKSGPRGWYNSDGYFNYCAISDMVQLEDTGQTGDYIHTYIVNNINGTWGSMTRSNIWVSAHTNDRYNCNLATDPVLSTITDSRLRVIRIVGCNYYE